MEIKSGPNKGYYNIQSRYLSNSRREVYSKLKLPKGKKITGFNSPLYFNGYYYIPRNDQLDIRKLVYALENNLMPNSGNTETFNRDFDKIVVPNNYCPHYLEPCIYDWCDRCKILKLESEFGGITRNKPELTEDQIKKRNTLVLLFSFFLASILLLALTS